MIGAVIETWNFDEIVKLSGFRNVVSTNYPPTALVHDGSADERVITKGVPAYFVTVVGLSSQAEERARQLLERLYALGDWASGEIVERHRRDQERFESGYDQLKPRLTVPQMLVRRFVKRNPGSALATISAGTAIATADVQSVVEHLCLVGILVKSDDREATYRLSPSELARHQLITE
ncbi:hypothetical protein HJB99_30900 [Rhizobium sp. NLR17b]|uniref:hypothetical protein n=1 Tax=Rhizobium sp. NLR17b TaxID=2731114 RepID=UPI001C83F4EC|nr:hypothetical protein [Rhizobium sp. NLR17b]MBX5273007.1 hypothetical protein [Rhizobium sp. NLR17b]